MSDRYSFLGVTLLGLSLVSLSGCQQDALLETKSPLNCSIILNADSVLEDGSRDIIIVGEVHGMEEVPAFVGDLVCQSLSRGLKTTLTLEIDNSSGLFSDFVSSDGGAEALNSLFQDSLWTNGFTDGRSSEAMLALLETARAYRQSGHDLEVSFFKSPVPPLDEPYTQDEWRNHYEASMGTNIVTAASGRDRTIALVGNVHARKTGVSFGNLNYRAMADHMPDERTVSLVAVTGDGTSWSCRGPSPDEIVCGSNNSRSQRLQSDVPVFSGPEIILGADRESLNAEIRGFESGNYDGIVLLGAATASPPANLNNREPWP